MRINIISAAVSISYNFIVLCYFRIEISDNGRSEGSEDSLPNETSVKFISEVSSKVSGVFASLPVQAVIKKYYILSNDT